MTSWVGSISYAQRDNWNICRRRSLFGSNTKAALGVRAGDEIFIWGSKQGWLGRCIATRDARPPHGVNEVPWPDPEAYTALIPMTVVDEPVEPLFMTGRDIEATAGIGTIQLPRFPRLNPARADVLKALLGGRPGSPSTIEEALRRELEDEDPAIPPGYDERSKAHRTIVQRRGQKAFRDRLIAVYGGACAITGTTGEAVLEAAHIRPYRGDLHNTTSNGLLLRADIHTLFDLHLLTVLPFGTIQVAPSLTDPLYASLDERMVRRPAPTDARPLAAALQEHNAACGWLRVA